MGLISTGFINQYEPRLLSKALEVVTRAIGTYLVKKSGFTHATAKTGAVTLIQRFGSN